MFRLAPPPSPPAAVSVSSASSVAGVVVVDGLGQDVVPDSHRGRAADADDTGAALSDDEEALLGEAADTQPSGHAAKSKSRTTDGVDSASESDNETSRKSDRALEPSMPRAAGVQRAGTGSSSETAPRERGTGPVVAGSDIGPLPEASTEALASNAASSSSATTGFSGPPGPPASQPRRVRGAAPEGKEGNLIPEGAPVDIMTEEDEHRPQAQRGYGWSSGALSRFTVRVPKSYPGIQYRKSKRLEDRTEGSALVAVDGHTVEGFVEDDGEWLRLRCGNYFLPMRINGSQLLHPLPVDAAVSEVQDAAQEVRPVRENPQGVPQFWLWSWCSGCRGINADTDIVVHGGPGGTSSTGGAGPNTGVPRSRFGLQ